MTITPEYLLESLSSLQKINNKRTVIIVKQVSDDDFINIYGNDPYALVEILVPDSVVHMIETREKIT